MKLNLKRINDKKAELENHPLLVTNCIQTKEDLKIFMQHHVYAVWDFMSLLKTIQHGAVPSGGTWFPTPANRTDIARMINEIVLCEETDKAPGGGSISHFDLYLQAMHEVGADTKPVISYLDAVQRGEDKISFCRSLPAQEFIESTFATIDKGVHCAAASFAFGRETVIPDMFKGLLSQLNINSLEAPRFHYYLERHIEVDGGDHGPMSEKLVEYFIGDDPIKAIEAEDAACNAIEARIRFFDQIELLLPR